MCFDKRSYGNINGSLALLKNDSGTLVAIQALLLKQFNVSLAMARGVSDGFCQMVALPLTI